MATVLAGLCGAALSRLARLAKKFPTECSLVGLMIRLISMAASEAKARQGNIRVGRALANKLQM